MTPDDAIQLTEEKQALRSADSPKGKKLFWGFGIGVILIGTLALVYFRLSNNTPQIQPVKFQARQELIEVSGLVESEHDIVLRSEISARIIHLQVKENTPVIEGTPLLDFDTSTFRLQLQQAGINTLSSKAQVQTDLKNAQKTLLDATQKKQLLLQQTKIQVDKAEQHQKFVQKELARTAQLLEKSVVTEQNLSSQKQLWTQSLLDVKIAKENLYRLQTDETEILAARSRINQAQTALRNGIRQGSIAERIARNNLAKASLLAPFNGTVTHWDVDPGDYVTPSISLGRFQDLDSLYLVVSVNELDFPKIHLKDIVNIVFDAYPGKPYKGEVAWITESSRPGLDHVNVFPIKIRFPNPKRYIKPGMSADAKIIVGQKINIMTIPASVVRKKKGKYFVEVLEQQMRKDVEITVGKKFIDTFEVKSGLKVGDLLILPPNTRLAQ